MLTETRPIGDLKPYPRNPRTNEKAIAAVAESIRQFGFRQPIVVDAENVIVCGHTRWKAAQKLGLAEVPVHVAKDLTPEQIRAYRIADNKTNELATWNMELLPIELTELQDAGFDMLPLGFAEEELGAFSVDPAAPADVPSGDKSPFQQMTFTLSVDQAEVVRSAITLANEAGPYVDTGNDNGNGNALARIAESYRG